eukprot:m.206538 g.206538  ORF g.206538 m.206538 type:complete len:362 (+) comp22044_c0_seq7:42-1127(+)
MNKKALARGANRKQSHTSTWFFFFPSPADLTFPLKTRRSVFPAATSDNRLWITCVPAKTFSLAAEFLQQSVLKQLLTEGERFVMTVFGVLTFAEQGVYDIVNNLASMVPRFIFQPIEENYYTFFAALLDRDKSGGSSRANEELAARTYTVLLKLVTLLGAIIMVFGRAYAFLLLDMYGGSLLSGGTGPALMRAFCVYIVLLAVNGVTECFASASMNEQQVRQHNRWLLLFSLVFVAASWGFTSQFGSVGFVYANGINMLVRILRSLYISREYFARSAGGPVIWQPLLCLPNQAVGLMLALSAVLTTVSENTLCCDRGYLYRFLHICVGAVCGIATLSVVYFKDRQFVRDLQHLWQGKARAA